MSGFIFTVHRVTVIFLLLISLKKICICVCWRIEETETDTIVSRCIRTVEFLFRFKSWGLLCFCSSVVTPAGTRLFISPLLDLDHWSCSHVFPLSVCSPWSAFYLFFFFFSATICCLSLPYGCNCPPPTPTPPPPPPPTAASVPLPVLQCDTRGGAGHGWRSGGQRLPWWVQDQRQQGGSDVMVFGLRFILAALQKDTSAVHLWGDTTLEWRDGSGHWRFIWYSWWRELLSSTGSP